MTDKIWTEEMAAAMRGTQILTGQFPLEDDTNRLAYYAAHAVAPVDLVPQGERAALKERDELRARFSCLQVVNAQQSAELALLRAQIAGFTAANVAPATPEPEPAFLRVLRRGNRAAAGIIGGMGDRP